MHCAPRRRLKASTLYPDSRFIRSICNPLSGSIRECGGGCWSGRMPKAWSGMMTGARVCRLHCPFLRRRRQAGSTPVLPAYSMPACARRQSMRRRRWRYSALAMPMWKPYVRRRTNCARARWVTQSAMSSTATSITPTCVNIAVASARFPRAVVKWRRVVRPMILMLTSSIVV